MSILPQKLLSLQNWLIRCIGILWGQGVALRWRLWSLHSVLSSELLLSTVFEGPRGGIKPAFQIHFLSLWTNGSSTYRLQVDFFRVNVLTVYVGSFLCSVPHVGVPSTHLTNRIHLNTGLKTTSLCGHLQTDGSQATNLSSPFCHAALRLQMVGLQDGSCPKLWVITGKRTALRVTWAAEDFVWVRNKLCGVDLWRVLLYLRINWPSLTNASP